MNNKTEIKNKQRFDETTSEKQNVVVIIVMVRWSDRMNYLTDMTDLLIAVGTSCHSVNNKKLYYVFFTDTTFNSWPKIGECI